MSKPLVERRTAGIIGCRIRPGQVPGGMTARVGRTTARHIGSDTPQVKEAANAFLEKRGFHRNPDAWRDQISQAVVEARIKAGESSHAPL